MEIQTLDEGTTAFERSMANTPFGGLKQVYECSTPPLSYTFPTGREFK